VRHPPPLRKGSKVRIVAPSSPFDRERFARGVALLETRYEVELGGALFEKHGFLAGDDGARLADLENALADPEVAALIAARGGYGATRLLSRLDAGRVRAANKWLVGFSDVTALHALWARAELCSIHGPMVASLWEAEASTQAAWFALLEGGAPRPLGGLSCVVPGRAEGRLVGGNLAVLCALVGTPHLPPLDDAIIVLEDVTERPYRVDRMLTTMLDAGFFAGARAIVLGQFTDCPEGPDGVTVETVLRERLTGLNVPIVANAPFGHVRDNHPLLLGARAEVDASAGAMLFAPPDLV
jgi:muramoyltetrapeptide carboxypeptidase